MQIQKEKRILTYVLILVMALALCAQALAETSVAALTGHDNAKVYDDEGNVLGTLPAQTEVTVTGVKGDVCRVERDGKTAYMMKGDLVLRESTVQTSAPKDAEAERPAQSVTAYVNHEGAKVYDADGKAEGTLGVNTALTVTGVKNDVCQVKLGGRTAYMSKSDLSASPVAAQSSSAEVSTSQETKTATAFVSSDGAKLYDSKGGVTASLGVNTQVTVTGVKGEACQVVAGGKKGYMRKGDLSSEKVRVAGASSGASNSSSTVSGGSTVSPARGTAREMDWWTSDIQNIFSRGTIAQITDVETGLSWREKRTGGTNHADCQPLTTADTAAMKKAYGGKWSWNRRAVFVTIDGVNYAASINGMPHGSGSIDDNDFNGHHCIHFTNSRTHGSNKVCPLHQAAIQKAASTRM